MAPGISTALQFGPLLALGLRAGGPSTLVAAAAATLTAAHLAMAALGFANMIVNTLGRSVLQLGATRACAVGCWRCTAGVPRVDTARRPDARLDCETSGAEAGLVIAGGTALLAGLAPLSRLHRLRRAVP